MELRNQAQGRWHGILTHLGVDPTFLRNRNGPCPGCGGTDRFRFDDKNGLGTFFCNCGGDPVAGDGFGLLKHVFECEFPAAAKMTESALGIRMTDDLPKIPKRPPPKPRNTSATAEQIWQATRPDEMISWDEQVASHPYAQLKGITHACGAARGRVSGRVVGRDADCIIVPLRTLSGRLIGVECIGAPVWDEQRKKHMTPKQTWGCKGALILGNTLDKQLPIYVVEGWADAASVWAAAGDVVVVVAFGGAARQLEIAKQIDAKNPERKIILLEDA